MHFDFDTVIDRSNINGLKYDAAARRPSVACRILPENPLRLQQGSYFGFSKERDLLFSSVSYTITDVYLQK